jgi:hypothetical protein
MAIRFTRSESWRDYLGTHNCTLIMEGRKEIGMIQGDTGCGGMRYEVTIGGKSVAQAYSLKEAKDRARQHLTPITSGSDVKSAKGM